MPPNFAESHRNRILGLLNRQNVARLSEILATGATAGMVLLVAMVGAIVLTLRSRPGVRRQRIAHQIDRRKEEAIELVKVPSGRGV